MESCSQRLTRDKKRCCTMQESSLQTVLAMALPFKGTYLIVTPGLSRGTRDRDTNLEPRIVFGNTFLFATLCLLQLHAVFFWCTQSSWLGVKYRLTNWLFMLSERKLNQTCADFSDHCINGTTCDSDTKICVTEDSKCCLYAIPGVLSTPFLRLWPTLSHY